MIIVLLKKVPKLKHSIFFFIFFKEIIFKGKIQKSQKCPYFFISLYRIMNNIGHFWDFLDYTKKCQKIWY